MPRTAKRCARIRGTEVRGPGEGFTEACGGSVLTQHGVTLVSTNKPDRGPLQQGITCKIHNDRAPFLQWLKTDNQVVNDSFTRIRLQGGKKIRTNDHMVTQSFRNSFSCKL